MATKFINPWDIKNAKALETNVLETDSVDMEDENLEKQWEREDKKNKITDDAKPFLSAPITLQKIELEKRAEYHFTLNIKLDFSNTDIATIKVRQNKVVDKLKSIAGIFSKTFSKNFEIGGDTKTYSYLFQFKINIMIGQAHPDDKSYVGYVYRVLPQNLKSKDSIAAFASALGGRSFVITNDCSTIRLAHEIGHLLGLAHPWTYKTGIKNNKTFIWEKNPPYIEVDENKRLFFKDNLMYQDNPMRKELIQDFQLELIKYLFDKNLLAQGGIQVPEAQETFISGKVVHFSTDFLYENYQDFAIEAK